MQIGHIDKGPVALHKEHKTHGNREPPHTIGQCRKAIKLITRGLGNIVSNMLVDEKASDFQKQMEDRFNSHKRKRTAKQYS